ncbi:MAG: SMC-Scp complex subunit ScpB [Pirellulales bacterium]|nr:SMC-Scp complex subunit ScpB [Pirellulales bacterium]
MMRLEAVLMLAQEPVAARKLAQLASLADATEARTLIGRLNELYDRTATAFSVAEIAGGYQLLSRTAYGPWLRRLHSGGAETRLSTPALETLAVVAYRQPVLRADVEAIRGVQCGEILRQLMERDLVRICGRSPELGRPFLYGTTKRFLQIFGLRHLDELPRAELFRAKPSQRLADDVPEQDPTAEHELKEEPAVTVVFDREIATEDELREDAAGGAADRLPGARRPQLVGAKREEEEEEEEDEEWEDEDEGDEEDDDWDEEEDDEEDEEEDEEDFEDAEWEEVDDEGDEEEGDEEEDEDWDDDEEDDDEDWDDEEEEDDAE